MKIGIISDIHGNHYALEQVLKVAENEGVEHFLLLGDIVGYYYHPEIVLEMLSKKTVDIIKGNHEVILKDLYSGKVSADAISKKYGSGHEKALHNLTTETLQLLFSLPDQRHIRIDNVSFQMNHGSPWSIDKYLYPDESKATLEQCNSPECDFVLVGHSHYSFSYRCKYSTLINCGSVGQSRQKGGLASWTIVNTTNSSFECKSTPYDIGKLLMEVQQFDPQFEYSSRVLLR